MPDQIIQRELGQALIEAITAFASKDIPPINELETTTFKHVRSAQLRNVLATTLHGARWLYKLGLVTLATSERRAAHVRAQIIDYAAICEGLLSDAIACLIASGQAKGAKHKVDYRKSIAWPRGIVSIEAVIEKRSFSWLISVAREEAIIKPADEVDLNWLRNERNAVHVRRLVAAGGKAYLGTSKKAFEVMLRCADATCHWRAAHP